jgi:hypothetical protein
MVDATCWVAHNGSMVIRRNTHMNWLILGCFGLTAIGMLWVYVSDVIGGREDSADCVVSAGMLILVIASWARTLIPESFTLNTVERVLEIKRGRSVARQIPFRRLARTIIATQQSLMGGEAVTPGLALMLDNGETIVLGTVFGLGAAQRAVLVAERISLATSTVIENLMPGA